MTAATALKARTALDVVDVLTDELFGQYRTLGERAVRRSVERAIADLSGSVHDDALAEMAIRLAMYRLDAGDGARSAG